MADIVNTGAAANDGSGDDLRTSFQLVNQRFQQLLGTLSQITWAPGLAISATPLRQWTVVAGQAYVAASNHTAGATFAADLAAGKWLAVDVAQLMSDLATTGAGKGAEMVALDDGASGSLWSTVAGFISRLASSAGSAVVGFIQSGSLAAQTTVQDELRHVVRVKQFGPTGNSSAGDDATFQKAIDHLHKITDDTGAQGVLEFDSPIFLTSPKDFGKNIVLRGKGRNFRSVIKPLASFSGSYLFSFDGDKCIGGWAFRLTHEAFTVDCSLIASKAQLPIVYKVNKCYDFGIDVWIYNAVGTGIDITASNWGTLTKPSLYGRSTDPAVSEFGIRCRAGSGSEGGIHIISPDVEVWFKGISQEDDARVTVVAPYCERNIIGWQGIGNSSGYLTVTGGNVGSPGASGTAASAAGDNITVTGGIYKANGGNGLVVSSSGRKSNVRLYGVAGDVTDVRSYALRDMDSTRWYAGKARSQKDVSDAVATTFFSVVVPSLSANFGVVDVQVNARDNSGYSLWTARYRFAVSNPDGTLRVSPVVEYAKSNVNISANYSLAITCATSVSGTTCNFQITADSGGALGNGQSSRISAEAELLQWDAAGGVYISAA